MRPQYECSGQEPIDERGAKGTVPARCEALLPCRQRAPAVPEVKALFLLKLGSRSSEELRSAVPLPVFKARSGLATILLRVRCGEENPPREILPLGS